MAPSTKENIMKVSPMIQAARERKIDQVIAATGCSRDYAISYLMTAAWFVTAAVDNYKAAH
jgi:hypothetical protein